MDPLIKQQQYGFATYPSVKVKGYSYNKKTKKREFGFKKELLFGDYIKPIIKNGEYVKSKIGKRTYIQVYVRGVKGISYIYESQIQPNRVLEVNFVDVAQGDGCHVVTPDDKHFIIDAGKGDNMARFLSWRFNLKYAHVAPPTFTGIITHSDEDHYGGFTKLFTHKTNSKNQFSFDTIFHNGMVEGSGKPYSTLGTITQSNGQDFVSGLSDTNARYKKRIDQVARRGNYIKLLEKTSAPKKSLRYGDSPIYEKDHVKIEVLGPVAEKVNGKDALVVFKKDKGKTKNGHSIILKLTIGKLKVLLGGDLNSAAENHLFKSFTGTDVEAHIEKIRDPKTTSANRKKLQKEVDEAIEKMNDYFGVDIAKACHHGSPDFTSEFLRAIHPIASVISSGDEESHCHPRPDTLGSLGKYGRGERPLIFNTELARSGKEFIELSNLSRSKKKERAVTVYGMINVRTDGHQVIIAQMLEKPRGSGEWDIHKLVWNEKLKEFEYKSKYVQ